MRGLIADLCKHYENMTTQWLYNFSTILPSIRPELFPSYSQHLVILSIQLAQEASDEQ
jgi:hypothetical protein